VSFRIRDMIMCSPATDHPMDASSPSARLSGLSIQRRARRRSEYIVERGDATGSPDPPRWWRPYQLIAKGQRPISGPATISPIANFLYMISRAGAPIPSTLDLRRLPDSSRRAIKPQRQHLKRPGLPPATPSPDPYAVGGLLAVGNAWLAPSWRRNEDVLAMLEADGTEDRWSPTSG